MLPTSMRVRPLHDVPPANGGRYVLYWMTSARRSRWNCSLDRAVDWARTLRTPLLVLETLRVDYPWASDRLHRFALDGMRDHRRAFEAMGIGYVAYVEPVAHEGRGLVRALAAEAAVVVTDRLPTIESRARVARALSHLAPRVEEVDANGLLPLDASPDGLVFPTAYAFRRYLQRYLPTHLAHPPRAISVLAGELPPPPRVAHAVLERWPPLADSLLEDPTALCQLPIDHAVPPGSQRGGEVAGRARLAAFVESGLATYEARRNDPDADAGSHLSAYLHYGHLGVHEVVERVLAHEQWTPASLAESTKGSKAGWWGVSASAEAFLDQVVTWRELGFNTSTRRADYDQFASLPSWALSTLRAHEGDVRPYIYSREQFVSASTHDPLWNAAQRQLVSEGRLHNYLRMLWGKKILEWTASPREALAIMVELNNRFALDGRDPNSYSGIFWVLGRYDRPWPVRPIFGAVRCMTSASTARKVRVAEYLRRYGE